MTTPENFLFSKFKPQEFEQLSQLLCRVFETSPKQLAELYRAIDEKLNCPGWPLQFAKRDFFKSSDEAFRSTYAKSPVIAVDLPSLMELDDGRIDKPTIAIIGQDSKSNHDYENLVVGTPYGLHHKGSREDLPHTKLYFDMIKVLLELGYRVYLTDLLKVWVCDPERRYYAIGLPNFDRQRFLHIIKPELDIIKPEAVITWGKVAGNGVEELKLGIKHLKFLHPSGAAGGAWRHLMDMPASRENKLAYWREKITQELGK
jgi:hypothetical protein